MNEALKKACRFMKLANKVKDKRDKEALLELSKKWLRKYQAR